MQWILDNWELLGSALGLVLALAAVIVRFTKTDKDDAWVRRIRQALSFIPGVQQPDPPSVKRDGATAKKVPLTTAGEREEDRRPFYRKDIR